MDFDRDGISLQARALHDAGNCTIDCVVCKRQAERLRIKNAEHTERMQGPISQERALRLENEVERLKNATEVQIQMLHDRIAKLEERRSFGAGGASISGGDRFTSLYEKEVIGATAHADQQDNVRATGLYASVDETAAAFERKADERQKLHATRAALEERVARLVRERDDLRRINDTDIPAMQKEINEQRAQIRAADGMLGAERTANAALEQQVAALRAQLVGATPEQRVLCCQIIAERHRQDRQWGGPNHDDDHNRSEWCEFVADHLGRAKKAQARYVTKGERGEADEFRKQMIEVAALAMAAIEAHDRKMGR